MQNQFDIHIKVRKLILKAIESLSLDQINQIPEGFNNNIAWNFVHIIVTQQILCYKLSGLDAYIDEETISKYKKGSAPDPNDKITQSQLDLFKTLFVEYPLRLIKDYEYSLFKKFDTYTTSVKIRLDSVEDAINFNNMHEGLHLGSILALKKVVTRD